jgi:hypothetical protein
LDGPDYADQAEFSGTVRGFVASVAKHQKIHTAIEDEGNENQNIRRKCKGGLQWASETNRKVHFCLDEIDMFAVVNKTVEDEAKRAFDFPRGRKAQPGEEKTRVYTNSELRWVYRNRFIPNVQTCVQFWLNFVP